MHVVAQKDLPFRGMSYEFVGALAKRFLAANGGPLTSLAVPPRLRRPAPGPADVVPGSRSLEQPHLNRPAHLT